MDNREKSKRSSSFLDKFSMNTFRSKEHKKREKGSAGTLRPPSGPSDDGGYSDAAQLSQYKTQMNKLSEHEVNAMFEKMLEDMNLTEEKKTPLRRFSLEQKRDMLIMQYKGNVQAQHKGKADTPQDFIHSLNNPELKGDQRYQVMSSLRVQLTNKPVSWVQEFGTHGLNGILRNLTYCYDNKSKKKKVPTATLR